MGAACAGNKGVLVITEAQLPVGTYLLYKQKLPHILLPELNLV